MVSGFEQLKESTFMDFFFDASLGIPAFKRCISIFSELKSGSKEMLETASSKIIRLDIFDLPEY